MITNKMISSLSKKLIIAFGIVAIVFNLFAPSTLAQNWYTPTLNDFNTKVESDPKEEIFGERYTQAQVYWIIYSLIGFLTKGSVGSCISTISDSDPLGQLNGCFSTAGIDNPLAMHPAGSLGPILDMAMFVDNIKNTRPASGIQYLAQKVTDIVPTAYAQTGFGYTTLSGAQNLWGAIRNMSYGLMVLVILVLAFGVMFRVKVSPQTSITIQSAIPKVVIALIAITFSFAIAGLLIDLSYLVQGIVAGFIVSTPTPAGQLSQRNVVEFLQIMNNPTYGVLSVGLLTVIVALIPTAVVVAAGVLIPFTGPVGAVAAIGGTILLLFLLLAFVVGLIKIIWLFLRTYAVLLINIVFGPFIILAGAVNLGGGFTGWIKQIVAQLSVFVVSSILIVVAHIFIWGSGFTAGWLAPDGLSGIQALNPFLIRINQASLGSASLPGLGNGGLITPGTLGYFTALVIILSIPSLASFVRDSISKPARVELGLGMVGGVAGFIGGAVSGGAQKRLGAYIVGDRGAPGLIERVPGALKIQRRPRVGAGSPGGGPAAGPDEPLPFE